MIYNEVQHEISTLPVEPLLKKCIEYIEQINKACSKDNLIEQNKQTVETINENLNKSYNTLNKIKNMKQKVNDKFWSSYFVKAIQNKTAFQSAKSYLNEAERNIEKITKGYFSYHSGFRAISAFLISENHLLLQDSYGNIYIYDSNSLKIISQPVKQQFQTSRGASKATAAFYLSKKKIGLILENANLIIYKLTFQKELTILKKIFIRATPASIQISKDVLTLNYIGFKVAMNSKNYKVLESNDKWSKINKMDNETFMQISSYVLLDNTNNSSRDVFKDKVIISELHLHTQKRCLSCLSWYCKKFNDNSYLLKYNNSQNQSVVIEQNGITI